MTIVNGSFIGQLGGLGGAFGGFGRQQRQASPFQQAAMQQMMGQPQNMFAQLQAQQQFNLAGTSQNGLSDLLGSQLGNMAARPAASIPEPEPQKSRAWGFIVVVW